MRTCVIPLRLLSSERAQLTPQWGDARFFRQKHPVPVRSFQHWCLGFTHSENVKLTDREQPLET